MSNIYGEECRVITVRTQDKIVAFYCPASWLTKDVNGISYKERGNYPKSGTRSFTGNVNYGNVLFPVTGTEDSQGYMSFYLMPEVAENAYDSTRI